MKNVIIKVDIDTLKGTKKCIVPLINIFKKYNINGTFYVSLGPDNTGKKIFQIFQKGFLNKVGRTSALKVYGIKNLMYGTFLSAPMIYKKADYELKYIADNGYETGVHAYDHEYWHSNLQNLNESEIKNIMDRAAELYYKIYKNNPHTFASPGWVISDSYYKVMDKFGLNYVSDTRKGTAPFFPVCNIYESNTLEIPTTLFTFDELIGLMPEPEIIDYYVNKILSNDFNLWTIHSEFEGGVYSYLFEQIIQKLLEENIKFFSLKQWYENQNNFDNFKKNNVKMDYIKGRALKVAISENI